MKYKMRSLCTYIYLRVHDIWKGNIRTRGIYHLAKTKLSHDPLLRHLLNLAIKDDLGCSQPVLSISSAHNRYASRISCVSCLQGVRLPNHDILFQCVELLAERWIASNDLLSRETTLHDKIVVSNFHIVVLEVKFIKTLH